MKVIKKENPNKGLSFLYKTKFGRIILKPVVKNSIISNISAWFLKSKLSTFMIKKFVSNNNINMDEYIDVKYKSFNDFFIRDIKPNARKFDYDKNCLCAPCDSYLTHYEINDNTFIIKNNEYNIKSLLQDDELANKYNNGDMLVFRLAPNNYHHYYYPFSGKLIKKYKIKGKFHSVNPVVYDNFKVFIENTREISVLDANNYGTVTYIEVGALLVGKIKNIDKKTFKTGEEKGYFEYGGSTIILLFEKNKISINDKIRNTSIKNYELSVKLGEKIVKKRD